MIAIKEVRLLADHCFGYSRYSSSILSLHATASAIIKPKHGRRRENTKELRLGTNCKAYSAEKIVNEKERTGESYLNEDVNGQHRQKGQPR